MQQQSRFPVLAHPGQFYIGGAWVDPASASTFNIINSSTEQVVAAVAEATAPDISSAVEAARSAFDEGPWPRLSHGERAGYLRAIASECERRADDFARAWTTESGVLYKLSAARVGAWLSTAFNYYAGLAATFPFQETPPIKRRFAGHDRARAGWRRRRDHSWNGPARLMAYKCAPALLAGCTIILKASPEAPSCAYLLAEICEQVHLPPGVLNIVTADRQASEALVRDPRVDKVTFTGSTAAGRKIASICGERIARYTLELGGKSPALVLDDYEIDTAAHAIAAGLGFLSGQVCHSLTRVIVTRARHDKMVDALSAAVQRMRVGDPFDPDVDVGPLATARQRERVEGYISKGSAEGAVLATGGRRPAHLQRGFFVEPTVFGNVDNRSTIAQEEIFGPVLCVIPADNEAHAIALANDTLYGLNASVFTHDVGHALQVARQLRAGTVGQNGSRPDFGIAFGGFKQSGLGREGGTEGLLPFLETKTVVLDTPFLAARI